MSTETLRVELHCHTESSYDGHIRLPGLLEMARRRQLDVVAITDHDTIEAAVDYQQYLHRTNGDLRIVVGEERTLSDNTHVIGLFLREPLQEHTLESVVEEVRVQGGVFVVPHPFRGRHGALRSAEYRIEAKICFEIFNGGCTYEENQLARGLVERGWIAVGGSDAHCESDLAQCVNLVRYQNNVDASLRAALAGHNTLDVMALRQQPGGRTRRYIPPKYRAAVPQRLRPVASKIFRYFHNSLQKRRKPKLVLNWLA